MAVRRRLMAGNWKMHKLPSEAGEFVGSVLELLERQGLREDPAAPEVVFCPPFVALAAAAQVLRQRGWPGVWLGAQNLHWEAQGAYTGEVSGPMLKDVGCRYVIVGHSERRQLFGESDEQVARKVRAALGAGLVPILCVGETLAERRAGQTEQVVLRQLRSALEGLSEQAVEQVVVAYEPVWAIGTGENATGQEAARVIGQVLRGELARRWGDGVAQRVRILYGGSVTPDNIAEFMDQPDIDGALVGGASLVAERFAAIVAAGRNPA